MKSFTIAAAVSCMLFGVCVFVSGCGATPATKPKMEMSSPMMSSDSKMSGNMMSEDKMPSMDKMNATNKMNSMDKMSKTEKMSGPKMNSMSEEKMEKGDATDK